MTTFTIEKAYELYNKAIRYSIGDSEVEIDRMTPEKFLTNERTLFREMYNSWAEMMDKIKEDKFMYNIVLKVNGTLGDYLNYMKEFIAQEETKK